MIRKTTPTTGLDRRSALAGLAAALLAWPLRAEDLAFDIDNMQPGDFTWRPERAPLGPLAVIVSLPEQRAHVYRNGVRIGVTTVSTGKPGHETPTGVFTVLQKDKDHHSSIYNNAAMPNTERLTWGGVALHAGGLPGYPSSHGCVHLPLEFSNRLFTISHLGIPVLIVGDASEPWDYVHPGLVLRPATEARLTDAVAAIEARGRPDDWTEISAFPATSVVATAGDRRITLIEDGVEILVEDLVIDGDQMLGEHVLLLTGFDDVAGGLRWVGVSHTPDPANPLRPEVDILARLETTDAFARALTSRLHVGMSFIVSDLEAHPQRRSDANFVILTGDFTSQAPPLLREDATQDG